MQIKSVPLAVALCLAGADSVHAAGFALIEHSASGMGNAFAGAAATAEDASTIWFNPAGMSRLSGAQTVLSGHLILPVSDFTNDNSTTSALVGGSPITGANDASKTPALVPNTYLVGELSDSLHWGLGINVPYGLTTEYDDNWVGRYHAVKSDMKTVNINPALAFQLNEQLSLGVGISAQYAEVELTSAVDFGSICYSFLPSSSCQNLGLYPQQNDGFARIAGNNWAYSWNAGLHYRMNDDTQIGLAYRSSTTQNVDGKVDFTVPGEASLLTASGTFTDTNAQAKVTLPATFSMSMTHRVSDELTLLADATLTAWSVFEELRVTYPNSPQPDSVTTENWGDSWRFSVGANLALDSNTTLRLGTAHDATPIPSKDYRTPRLPGDDRWWLSIGLGHTVNKNLHVDVGYSHLFVADAKANNTLEGSVPTIHHTLNGEYEASVDIFSAQAVWTF